LLEIVSVHLRPPHACVQDDAHISDAL